MTVLTSIHHDSIIKKLFDKEHMARLKDLKHYRKISLQNIEKNSPSKRLLDDEGFSYLRLVENL